MFLSLFWSAIACILWMDDYKEKEGSLETEIVSFWHPTSATAKFCEWQTFTVLWYFLHHEHNFKALSWINSTCRFTEWLRDPFYAYKLGGNWHLREKKYIILRLLKSLKASERKTQQSGQKLRQLAFCHLSNLHLRLIRFLLLFVILSDELGLLRRGAGVLSALWFWEVLGQEPEGDASQNTDHTCY